MNSVSSRMVTDRTSEDVQKAIELKKRGLPFTAAEEITLERGTYSIETINRIANALHELSELTKDAGYWVEELASKTFEYGDIFYVSDYAGQIKDTYKLYIAVDGAVPQAIVANLNYAQVNLLEKLIARFGDRINEIDEYAPECGAVSSGDELSVSDVSLNIYQINSMTVGKTYQLIATVSPSTAINKAVTWSSSNSAIVSVSDNGLLTAKAASTSSPAAIVTVKTVDGDFTASCAVVRVQADSSTTPTESNFILSDGSILVDANEYTFTTSDSTSVSTENNFVLSDMAILIDANSLTFLTKKEE